MQRWLHVEAFVADGPPQKVEPTDRGAESTPPGKPRRRWIALPTRYNSVAGGGRLQFFAPHQPRLDHQLFYEGVEINLAGTVLYRQPYRLPPALRLPAKTPSVHPKPKRLAAD
jgi:hypothetical protein